MTFQRDSNPHTEKQPARGHHHLVAKDAVIRLPPERALKCAEADLKWALSRVVTLERKPRTRKPSLATRVKAVRRAGAEAEIMPDGRVLSKEKAAAESKQANGAELNPWDEVPAYV